MKNQTSHCTHQPMMRPWRRISPCPPATAQAAPTSTPSFTIGWSSHATLTCNHMMHPPQNYPATQVARQPRSPPQLPTPKPIPVHVLHPLPAPAPTTPRRMLRTSYPRRMLRTSYQPILPITIPTKLTTRPHARPPIMPPITNLPYKPNPALGQPMCPAYIQPDDERLGWQCRKMCLSATPLKQQTFLSVADMSEMSS